MIPTKRLWFLFALGIPLAFVATAIGMGGFIFVYNGLLLFLAYLSYKLGPDPSHVRVLREFDPVLSVRQPNRVKLQVFNDGGQPIEAEFRDEGPSLATATMQEFSAKLEPEGVVERTYHVTPFERGGDYFRGTFMRLSCPLGLVQKEGVIHSEQPVRIYPNVLALREFDLLNQRGRLRDIGIRRSRDRGLGSEFESLRDYAKGDDYRKIDWKASARRDKLVVRQYETERYQPVIICIDTGREMLAEVNGVRKLDRVLDSTLLLAHAVVAAGDFIGLLVYSDGVHRYLPPRKGRAQMASVIDAIHDLNATPVHTDHRGAMAFLASRWKRRSLMISFTDIPDQDHAHNLVAAMSPVSRRHLTLVARISDPNLRQAYDMPLENADALYYRAAAGLLVEDRKMATAILTSARIHTLEAEPDQLSSALVTFYFKAKERSMI